MDYQKITIVGHLGQDPVRRVTKDGIPVTSFSIAVNKRFTRKDGTAADSTTWFRITVWRNLAESCAKYLSKGAEALVEGELLPPSSWLGRDGTPHASNEVLGLSVQFGQKAQTDRPAPNNDQDANPIPSLEDEDEIPF